MRKLSHTIITFAVFMFLMSCENRSNKKQFVKPEVQNQGVKIDYTDNGKGDTTLLFVHGWCINKSYWTDQVAFFSKKYRVVTMDLPGFGKSGKNRTMWNTENFGKDVNTVIAQLHLKNVILIGHSMAGDIVVQAAINSPKEVIGLVGIDNFKNVGVGETPSRKDTLLYNQYIDSLKHHFKTLAFEYVNHDLFYKTTENSIRQRVLNDVANSDSTIAAACLELNKFDEVAALTKANKKLCLINSDVKPTNTAGLKAKKISFQVWYIHATGHFPMIEKPQEFNLILQNAINNIRG